MNSKKAKIDIEFLNKFSLKNLYYSYFGVTLLLVIAIAFAALWNNENSSYLSISLFPLVLVFLYLSIGFLIIRKVTHALKTANDNLKAFKQGEPISLLNTKGNDDLSLLIQNIQQTIITLNEHIEEKKDLVALLSHDLRSPVNKIIGLAQLIPLESDKAYIDHNARQILEQANQQLELLESILDLLREEKQELEPEKIEEQYVKDFIMTNQKKYKENITNKGLTINTKIPKNLKIKGQKDLIDQVFSNLLHNAIKFSNRGGRINIEGGKQGNKTFIAIKDEGIGFQNSEKEKLFDRFTSIRKKGTEEEPTTGLGLYLCKKIIEKHHGSIEAKSDGENKGATFTIFLPA